METTLKSVTFITRKDWKAAPPRRPYFDNHIPRTITIHHYMGQDDDLRVRDKQMLGFEGPETMRELQKYDMQVLQLNDLRYHLVIDFMGHVWQGRNLEHQGAHVKSNNNGNIGILMYGNFEVEEPKPAMVMAFKKVLIELKSAFLTLDFPKCLKSHREFAFTVCPGKHIYDIINGLKYLGHSLYEGVENEVW